MKSKHKPIAVKVGNVTVKIYRVKNRGYDSFQVADYSTGKRKLESFASEREARDAANTIAVKVAKLDGAVLTLSSNDRLAYLRALELLKPTGVPLELAAAYFTEAQTKLAGRSLNEAVEYFLKRNPSAMPRKTVSEIFTEFLIAKQADGVSAVYLKDLKFRVGKFAEAFQGQMADVDAAQVNEWLRGAKVRTSRAKQLPTGHQYTFQVRGVAWLCGERTLGLRQDRQSPRSPCRDRNLHAKRNGETAKRRAIQPEQSQARFQPSLCDGVGTCAVPRLGRIRRTKDRRNRTATLGGHHLGARIHPRHRGEGQHSAKAIGANLDELETMAGRPSSRVRPGLRDCKDQRTRSTV